MQTRYLDPQMCEWNEAIVATINSELNTLFPSGAPRRVLLILPPDADASLFNYDTGKRGRYWNYPPYGLGILASCLRRLKVEADILNLNNIVLKACIASTDEKSFSFEKTIEEALTIKVCEFIPDMIGISCMFSQTHRSTVNICQFVRSLAPAIPIALGGVHITNSLVDMATRKHFLADFPEVDLFFLHESEVALSNFIRTLAGECGVENLSQLLIKGRKGNFQFINRNLPNGEDLDRIPAHDLITSDELARNGKIGSFYCLKPTETRFTTLIFNRGCRASCTFCSVRQFNGKGVRGRSVQSTIDELLILRQEYGIGHIMWLDDDLLYNHERALNLFNEMVRQDVGITWDCTNGVIAASCTNELMHAAAESGCIGLNIGMESGNPTILRKVRKPGAVKNFLNAAKILRKIVEINARVFLMIGFPSETFRMIMDTINIARQMDLDWYNVTILQPLPNTPIFDEMLLEGLIDAVDFSDIRYNSGSYGKHRKKTEKSGDLLATDFKNAFAEKDLDSIPNQHELDDVWAFMNFHLNFAPLARETRPVKLYQKFKYVQNISELVAPENAFSHYFSAYLAHRLGETIPGTTIQKLEHILSNNAYWQQRFQDFNLALEDVKRCDFSHISVC